MDVNRTCRRCEAVLREYATGGLCPRCLLREGLDAQAEASPAETQGSAALVGRQFGDYELLEQIAHGGMGVVYKARQRSLGRIVAVKVLLAGQFAEPRFIQRFRAEAEAAACLQHPNIVAIHEIGEHEGYQYFSMDYVEGKNLAQVRQEFSIGAINFTRCARWLKTMAEAVHYAHQRGIVHRDLKPANILIDSQDEPHITDFGLAKRLVGPQLSTLDPQLTVSGQVLGSPNYLPPEQAAGKPAGPSSDVYSLGAILYHLLTGRPPFEAESLTSVLKQVLETDPVSPRLLNPGIPRDLATIAQKCLEKEPSWRYATAQALADDLGRFLTGEPIQAQPMGTVGRVWKWCGRQPVRAGLLAALLVVFLLGTSGISWQWRRAERERAMALRHAYAGDIKGVQTALEEGNLRGALHLLGKHWPNGKDTDLRGWEWRYLWGACRSDERSKLLQKTTGLSKLALSPDARLLAVQQADGNIELWDWQARRHQGTLTNRGYPAAMALSADGRLIASSNRSHKGEPRISLYDVETRELVHDLSHPSPVTSLAFSPDGKLLAAFHMGPMCSLWRVSSGEFVTNYAAGLAINMDMRIPLFSADSSKLILTDHNDSNHSNAVRCLDLQTGSIRETPASHGGNSITALALSPDGRCMASGSGYSVATIELWDFSNGTRTARLEGHRGWVKTLAFSSDGQTLYSGSADQSIRSWDIASKKSRHQWKGHTGLVTGLAATPDGEMLLSCASDGSVRIWDTRGPARPPSYIALPIQVGRYGAPFTSDGRRLITASITKPVTVWEVATGREIESIPALGTNLLSIALSPDERWLATGSLDGIIQIWDMRQQTIVSRIQANTNRIPIFAIRFLAVDNSLLSLALVPHQLAELKRWETITWREIPSRVAEVTGCFGFAPYPDGTHLVMSYSSGPAKLWDLSSGQLEATFGTVGAYMPAISRDARLLATPRFDGCTSVWELKSGRLIGSVEQQINPMVSSAFSQDGHRLITGSQVGGDLQPAIEVWDYLAGRELLSLRSQGNFTGWTEFSPDGSTLLALSWDGVAELWHAPSWAEIASKKEESHL